MMEIQQNASPPVSVESDSVLDQETRGPISHKRTPGHQRKHPKPVVVAAPPVEPQGFSRETVGEDNCIEVAPTIEINHSSRKTNQANGRTEIETETTALSQSEPDVPTSVSHDKVRLSQPKQRISARGPIPAAPSPSGTKKRRVSSAGIQRSRKPAVSAKARLAVATAAAPSPPKPKSSPVLTPLSPPLPDVPVPTISNGELAVPSPVNKNVEGAKPIVGRRRSAGTAKRSNAAKHSVRFVDQVIEGHLAKIRASMEQADKLIEEAETGFPPETVYLVVHDSFRDIKNRSLHTTAFVQRKSANQVALEIFHKTYLQPALSRRSVLEEVSVEELGRKPPGYLAWALDYEGDGCLFLIWSEENMCHRVYVYRQKVEKTHIPGAAVLGGPLGKETNWT